jgi:RHS repeat-associated protein
MQNSAVNPQTTYDNAYTYPAPGSAHPHSPTAIGEFNLTTDANGNEITTQDTKTSDVNQYLFDEENRLSCTNKGPQMPSPSCIGSNLIDFIYDHAGVRKIKSAATPTIYPNQYYTDIGGGSGNQFKHIFIGSERILTKKSRIAPDREHWYYHPDHLGSTAMVTNEQSQLADAMHYFPFGEVWLEERPSSLPADYFFTAKEFDPETGFYNFGARYLDPRFSKWMTADPALGKYLPDAGKNVAYQSPSLANNWRGHPDLPGLGGAFQPQNLAAYTYGHSNPATLTDPNGRAAQLGLGCGIGAGIGVWFGGAGAAPGCGIGAAVAFIGSAIAVAAILIIPGDTMTASGSDSGSGPGIGHNSAGTGNSLPVQSGGQPKPPNWFGPGEYIVGGILVTFVTSTLLSPDYRSSGDIGQVGQVPYGSTDLSRAVQAHRLKDGGETGKTGNYAAARLDDGTIISARSGEEHSEAFLVEGVKGSGRKIVELYSERQPCNTGVDCAKLLRDTGITKVSWTWKWNGLTQAEKADVTKEIVRTARELFKQGTP